MSVRAWQGVTYGVSGDAEVRDVLANLALTLPTESVEVLGEESSVELTEADRRAPLDVDPPKGRRGGELRASGRVEGPLELETNEMGWAIAFGGPDVPYAIAQHQRFYRHQVGQRLYLISTIQESRRYLGQRLVRRLSERLQAAGR